MRVAGLPQVMVARQQPVPYLAPELLHATSAGCAPPEVRVPELVEAPVTAQSVKPGLLMCLSCSSIGKPARQTRFTSDPWVKAPQEQVQSAGLGMWSQDVWWAGKRIRLAPQHAQLS